MSLPWFLRIDERPESTSAAQAVWIYGQWHYLPISIGGHPILRFCTSIEGAHAVAFEFEKERYDIRDRLITRFQNDREGRQRIAQLLQEEMRDWIIQMAVDCPPGWPESFRLYSISRSRSETVYLIREDDGSFLGETFHNGIEALVWLQRNFQDLMPEGPSV